MFIEFLVGLIRGGGICCERGVCEGGIGFGI